MFHVEQTSSRPNGSGYMKQTKTQISDAVIVTPHRYTDERGYFEESWNDSIAELSDTWVQDNASMSFAGVLRGLHIQSTNPQGKLVRCAFGTIFDVIVDLRPSSPTFKQHQSFVLDSNSGHMLWSPPGCAHGFFTLSRYAVVTYKCSTKYDKESDGGILWSDPELAIEWPFEEGFTPHVSLKDSTLPTMSDYLKGMR